MLTGASGFVGRHCLAPLAALGFEVHALSSTEVAGLPSCPAVCWHQTDLLDAAQVSLLLEQVRPTHLLHCAWYAVPGKYWNAPDNIRWVEASLHLLQRFVAVGGQRALGVGTCAEYDWRGGDCSEENTPLNPATTYGACKHALRLFLDALGEASGLSTAWARLFFLYGPHEHADRLVPSLVRSALKRQPARCSDAQRVRDFLYVRDAGAALAALLDSTTTGAVNVASGVPVSFQRVIETIAAQLHSSMVIEVIARPQAEDEPSRLVADISRLRDEVGWTPVHNLESGLAETINWWKSQSNTVRLCSERSSGWSH
jgi:nucleoside-diphosphate-sugar epimerase